MLIPEEAYGSGLTDYQFRLLAYLCSLGEPGRPLGASVEQMATSTGGVAVKTVRRALAALEEAGYIQRERTKKAGGMRGPDRIALILGDSNVHTLGDSNVHTTHDKVTNSSDSQLSPVSKVSYKEDTSYLLNPEGVRERGVVVLVRKGYDDGDDLAGFGLLEPKEEAKTVKKSDPKTRGRRPQSEWTAMDVASEFSFLVGRKFPWLPGSVNVHILSRALAKYRAQYETTALLELELLRIFMADEYNFKDVGTEAPHLYKRYLASFRTQMNKARQNLGLDRLGAESLPVEEVASDLLTASDGRTFQNTLSGRAQLKRHEERISR